MAFVSPTRVMVLFCNADKDEAKKAALLEMQRIALEHKVRVVDGDAFQYYESWKYPVLRELAPMMPGATPRDVADACKEHVSAEEVRDVLNFLVKAGFLKKDGEKEGEYLLRGRAQIAGEQCFSISGPYKAEGKEELTWALDTISNSLKAILTEKL